MTRYFKSKSELIDGLITKDSYVLDVGFWGQGVSYDDNNWVHRLIGLKTKNLYGIDLDFDISKFDNKDNYFKVSAEDFSLNRKFEIIFAGDLIEHLSNPGMFLNSCKKHLEKNGKLIITTPNTFNLFNIAGKIMNTEPVVNYDHTCYYNSKTITQLLKKNGWGVESVSYLYSLGVKHKESIKKKILNLIYWTLSLFTVKYMETMVIVAVLDHDEI